jgi:general secretion pathway protein D
VNRLYSSPIQILALVASLLLAGCATDRIMIDGPLVMRDHPVAPVDAGKAEAASAVTAEAKTTALTTSETPKPPPAVRESTVKLSPPVAQLDNRAANITVNLEQISLPAFIQTVYGNLLKRTFNIDPAIAQRKDLITFRAAKEQTAADLDRAATMVLKSYGVTVVDAGGLIRFLPDNPQAGYSPEIRRGRAQPDVPMPMRPVFQLVELEAGRAIEIQGILATVFGTRVTVVPDGTRNALLISGQPADITATIEAIQVLDQPLLRGRTSARINPSFWPADELAKKLGEILATEGYATSAPGGSAPIMFVPVGAINSLLVFAVDAKVLAHVVNWATELDKPNAQGRPAGNGIFSYQVRNTDAASLAKVLSELLSAPSPNANQAPQLPVGFVGTGDQARAILDRQTAAQSQRKASRVVVDSGSNTLILQGTSEEYAQIIPILRELDRPARSAYMQVTVARVSRRSEQDLGVRWSASASVKSDSKFTNEFRDENLALKGIRVGTVGAVANIAASLNLTATDNDTTLLSNPILVARNGESASFQVGTEVPIKTSTQTTGATTGILESFQYRQTGIVVKLKPVIFSNDRIDLEVDLEVSDQAPGAGVGGNPGFSTNRLQTKLPLMDGEPILLAGLIGRSRVKSKEGIPYLKDIPGLGRAFGSDADTENSSELMILITPYVISNEFDSQAVTREFRNRLGPWIETTNVVTKVKNEKAEVTPK